MLIEEVGDLGQYSTRELYRAARLVKAAIRARPTTERREQDGSGRDELCALAPDDRIDQGLAENLPWGDGEIDLGITGPPYCLGEEIAYAGGGDYDDYAVYREELVPAWCRELFRVANPDDGRWCIDVPIDIAGRSRRAARRQAPLEPKPVYADWLQALLSAGVKYRTTIV